MSVAYLQRSEEEHFKTTVSSLLIKVSSTSCSRRNAIKTAVKDNFDEISCVTKRFFSFFTKKKKKKNNTGIFKLF